MASSSSSNRGGELLLDTDEAVDALSRAFRLPAPPSTSYRTDDFARILVAHGTHKQQAEWRAKAAKRNVASLFALEEIFDGTPSSRSVQTMAAYDAVTEQFVLRTCAPHGAKVFWTTPAQADEPGSDATLVVVVVAVVARLTGDPTAGEAETNAVFCLEFGATAGPGEDGALREAGEARERGIRVGTRAFGGHRAVWMTLSDVRVPFDAMLSRKTQALRKRRALPASVASSLDGGAPASSSASTVVVDSCEAFDPRLGVAAAARAVSEACEAALDPTDLRERDHHSKATGRSAAGGRADRLLLPLSTAYALRAMAAHMDEEAREAAVGGPEAAMAVTNQCGTWASIESLCHELADEALGECRRLVDPAEGAARAIEAKRRGLGIRSMAQRLRLSAHGARALVQEFVRAENETHAGEESNPAPAKADQAEPGRPPSPSGGSKGQRLGKVTTYLSDARSVETSARCSAFSHACFLDPHVQLSILRHHASILCVNAVDRLARDYRSMAAQTHLAGGSGKRSAWAPEQEVREEANTEKVPLDGPVWEACEGDLVRLSDAHALYVLFSIFQDKADRCQERTGEPGGGSGSARKCSLVVRLISSYWILEHIKANLSVFVQTNYINRGQTQMLLQVLAKLRPTMELEVFQLVRALNARTGEPGVLGALVQAVREEHGLNGPKL